MHRILTLISLLLAVSLLAAACGDDDDSTTTAGSDDTADLPVDDGVNNDLPVDDDVELEEPTDDAAADDAQDLPLGAGPYPIADLFISADDGAGTTSEYRLACLGDTATFTGDVPAGVEAGDACLAIATDEARALLDANLMIDRACTEIYGGPETARITGTLDGTDVAADVNRTNGCGIDDWDRVFAGLLPPAG